MREREERGKERERGGEGGRARGTVRKPFAPNGDAPPLTTNAQRGRHLVIQKVSLILLKIFSDEVQGG